MFTDIGELKPGQKADIFAIAVGNKTPKKSRGDHFMMCLALIDPSFDISDTFFTVNVFRSSAEILEKLKHATIVAIKNVSVQTYGDKIMGVANAWCGLCAYDLHSTEPLFIDGKIIDPPTAEMISSLQQYARDRNPVDYGCPTIKPTDALYATAELTKRSPRPTLTLSQVADSKFCDMVCEILDVIYKMKQVVLVVTDYTSNPLCMNKHLRCSHIDEKMTFFVALWDNNADFMRDQEIKGECFAKLINIRPKTGTKGLEGNIHGSEKVHVEFFKEGDQDPMLKALKTRRMNMKPADEVKAQTFLKPEATLMTVKQIRQFKKTPMKFYTRLRVTKTYPENVTEFTKWVSPTGEVLDYNSVGTKENIYRSFAAFYLIASDETGEIPILVYNDDFKAIFGVDKSIAHPERYCDMLIKIHELMRKEIELSIYAYEKETPNGVEIRYRFLQIHSC